MQKFLDLVANSQSKYIIYADESGDHSLNSTDKEYPVFVLAFCIFEKNDYIHDVLPRINAFKFKFFGDDRPILHGAKIRKPREDFGFLTHTDTRKQFLGELNELLQKCTFSIITTAIDKRQFSPIDPENIYKIALQACLEQTHIFLSENNALEHPTRIILERRGLTEDQELIQAFRQFSTENQKLHPNIFEIVFADKKTNNCGLQIADLAAYPIGRFVLDPGGNNRSFATIEQKLVRRNARAEGAGLQIIPEASNALKQKAPASAEALYRPELSNP